MFIPKEAYIKEMPITQNIPVDISGKKTWFQKFKAWKQELPKEKIIEDFYQILPKSCNELLGYDKNIDVCCLIPKNFIFNGASIPKIFSNIYLPNGILYLGAVFHDFLYTYGGLLVFTKYDIIQFKICNQEISDKIFYEVNMDFNDFESGIKPAYKTLRMFGSSIWNKIENKEINFIKDFPKYKSFCLEAIRLEKEKWD